jgi:hypothetical protein
MPIVGARLAILTTFLAISPLVVSASPLDVTSALNLDIAADSKIGVLFNVSSFVRSSGGSYPTALSLQIIASEPGGSVSFIPGTSQVYFSDVLLSADLVSRDGKTVVPLTGLWTQNLGLNPGSLIMTPGSYSGTAASVGIINARASLTPEQSRALFGPYVASPESIALLRIVNSGAALAIGGSNLDVAAAITINGVSGQGAVSTGAITRKVYYVAPVPEPGTIFHVTAAAALLLLCFCFRHYSARTKHAVQVLHRTETSELR